MVRQPDTSQMSVYQPDPLVSAWLLLTLWTFMAVPLFLIHKQFKLLCDYDGLLIAIIPLTYEPV